MRNRFYILFLGGVLIISVLVLLKLLNENVDQRILKVTIPEGFRVKEIALLLDHKGVIEYEKFIEAVREDYSHEFDFLSDKPREVDLQGYLFPDTYYFYEGESATSVIKKFLSNFDKKLNQKLRIEIEKSGRSIHEVVVMASILEKEAKSLYDKKLIADILWRRLEAGMRLEVDATYLFDEGFRSYSEKGLPPRPIANPGMESLLAAIYPKTNSFWFYFSHKGGIIYSESFKEHVLKREKLEDEN
ncbi:MAG: endolytic transglycosylase MltG [Patescibacteria group bacterium]|nr:endolytic transglycosylase MltG [Patescibacteria group bacterium]